MGQKNRKFRLEWEGIMGKRKDLFYAPLEDEKNMLFAPSEYWDLPETTKRSICNGCGSKGLCGWVVPDTIYFLNITEVCNIHDWMYHVGETIADKVHADNVFLNNLLRFIDRYSRYDWIKRLRTKRAEKYYNAVKRFGGPAFWNGKNKEEELEKSALYLLENGK